MGIRRTKGKKRAKATCLCNKLALSVAIHILQRHISRLPPYTFLSRRCLPVRIHRDTGALTVSLLSDAFLLATAFLSRATSTTTQRYFRCRINVRYRLVWSTPAAYCSSQQQNRAFTWLTYAVTTFAALTLVSLFNMTLWFAATCYRLTRAVDITRRSLMTRATSRPGRITAIDRAGRAPLFSTGCYDAVTFAISSFRRRV